MTEKTFLVGTTNQGKLGGVELAVQEHAQRRSYLYSLVGFDVPSDVSDTPLSDDEMLHGCANRIERLRELQSDAAGIYIANEGGLAQTGLRWYVRGWTVVYDAYSNQRTEASGASVPVPDKFYDLIGGEGRISDAFDGNPQQLREIGINGL